MLRRVLALLVFVAAPTAIARTDTVERITSFDNDIIIAADGTLAVTETIAVNATGANIVHGIFRNFPTDYTAHDGRTVHASFDIVSASLDDHSEPYAVAPVGNGVQLKIGDKDIVVTPGRHVFVVKYTTAHQIGHFPGYDELYWNVTGNGWSFAIDRASATIHLPQGAGLLQRTAYTGALGSTASDARIERRREGAIRFVTTHGLAPQEGLTVALDFTKGAGSEDEAPR